MSKAHFLWVDDEIEIMKPYILFLEEKGYKADCASNGNDALEMCKHHQYDILFLDEQMPGLSGLEVLEQLNDIAPHLPVVMVTRSDDEGIMEQAIGRKISDYLIKPVNPNQVLLTIKKILNRKELIAERITVNYRDSFIRINELMNRCDGIDDWMTLYVKLVKWELELHKANHPLKDLLDTQKRDANRAFGRFIRRHYKHWVLSKDEGPTLSHELFEKVLLPILKQDEKIFFIVIDNFRLDQWLVVKDVVTEYFSSTDALYCSILPSATPYARNAIFSGLMPRKLKELYPDLWVDEGDEEGKNMHEEELMRYQLERHGIRKRISYYKINSNDEGERLISNLSALKKNDLNIVVINFIDMLSHAVTDSKMIKELAIDDDAYRSLTRSWFLHSSLRNLLESLARMGQRVVLTTDHGAIRVKNGVKIMGERDTNVSLRYKLGRNLGYDPNDVFDMLHPENYGLPSPDMSSRYIFALNDDLLAYPNRFNHYVSFYENSYQHGGVSMEEMLIPIITLLPK